MTDPIEILRAQLNGETGQLSWKELERHFARGVVIRVARSLDLVAVAASIAQDDKYNVERWISEDLIGCATNEQALDWQQRQANFWAVVTAPWVLVQETGPALNA